MPRPEVQKLPDDGARQVGQSQTPQIGVRLAFLDEPRRLLRAEVLAIEAGQIVHVDQGRLAVDEKDQGVLIGAIGILDVSDVDFAGAQPVTIAKLPTSAAARRAAWIFVAIVYIPLD